MSRTVFTCIAIALMVGVLPTASYAQGCVTQPTSICLSDVDGLYNGMWGYVETDGLITFTLRVQGGSINYNISNGWRIYSPDGAVNWTTTTAAATGTIGLTEFNALWAIYPWGVDGLGADTIGVAGYYIEWIGGVGLYPGFDDDVWTITIGPIGDEWHGKTICIDSCFYEPGGHWTWVDVHPDWQSPADGGYCFTIIDPDIGVETRAYYVAPPPTGDDANSGGSSDPFETIQYAIDQTNAGDTIRIASGTYSLAAGESNYIVGKHLIIEGDGAASTTIEGTGSGDLSFGLRFLLGVGTSEISGISFRNLGFGIEAINCGDLVINDCGLTACDMGVYIDGTSATVNNCDFDGNIAFGLILYVGNATARVNGGSFTDHPWRAVGGSTIAADNCTLENVNFVNNYSDIINGAVANGCTFSGGTYGYCTTTGYRLHLNGCVFDGMDTAMTATTDTIVMEDCEIRNVNHSIATIEDESSVTFINCDIHDNLTGIRATAGAVGSRLQMDDCLYYNNDSGIVYTGTSSLSGDNGLYLGNNMIAYNGGDYGVYFEVPSSPAANCFLENNIIALNEKVGVRLESDFTLACNDIYGHSLGNYENVSDQTGVNGNISDHPFFCDPSGLDYTLSASSPCLPANNDCAVLIGVLGEGTCSIAADEVQVTNPLPGEPLIGGTVYPIEWIQGSNVTTINIDYATSETGPWTNIVTGYTGSTYGWESDVVLSATNFWVRAVSTTAASQDGSVIVARASMTSTGSIFAGGRLYPVPIDDGTACASQTTGASPVAVCADEWSDGNLGLALGYADGTVSIYPGLVSGCVGESGTQVIADSAGLCAMASRDINNDWYIDLVLANAPLGYVAVYLADGVGGFGLYGSSVYAGCEPVDIGLCDFDKDGNEDIWLVGVNPATAMVMPGDGSGAYATGGWSTCLSGDPASAADGDLNNDGLSDLAVSVGDEVWVYLGSGDCTFVLDNTMSSGHGAEHVLIADFDKNGYNDIGAVTTDSSGLYALFANNGSSFGLELYQTGQPGATIAAAVDFIGNGYLDLVLTCPNSDQVVVLPGMQLDGQPYPKLGQPWPKSVGTNPIDMIVRDFNLDGKPDILVLTDGDGQALTFTGQSVPEVANNIAVLSPNGGETLLGDSLVTISWTKDFGVGAVDIQVSRDNGGSWETIAYNLIGTSYVWHVWGPSSDNALIRVRSSSIFANNDVSDATFVIDASCCIGLTGNVNNDPDDICDIGDLTNLIGYLFIPPFEEPECMDEANVDGTGVVDIGDLTSMIGYLFIPPFDPPAACP